MNNSNKDVSIVVGSALDQIQNNINVGMEDVVAVFLSRYETSLHTERATLQKEMGLINGQIKTLHDGFLTLVKEWVEHSGTVGVNNFGLVEVEVKLEKNLNVDWNKGVVNYVLETSVRSLSVDADTYRSKSSGTVAGVHTIDVTEYNQLMEQKNVLTEKLTIVNNNLRDVSRKERQVRGQLAELKLKNLGMEDLLNEPTLIGLINNPLQS